MPARLRDQHISVASAAVLLAACVGCQLIQPQSTVVAPHAAQACVGQDAWLRSLTVHYQCDDAPTSAGATALLVGGVEAGPKRRQLLAIRYPHPYGHTDRARAELVRAQLDANAAAASPSQRLMRILQSVTPGVYWAPGITEAKGLDLSVMEMQRLIDQTRTVNGLESNGRPSQDAARLHVEVNGQSTTVDGTRFVVLDALADRVRKQGKLISCRASADELFADRPRHAVAAVAELTPLPQP